MMAFAQGPIHPIDAPPAIYHHGYRGALTVRQGSLAEVEHFCHTQTWNCVPSIARWAVPRSTHSGALS